MGPVDLVSADPTRARALDLDVALEVGGYRWIEWNEWALAGASRGTRSGVSSHPHDLLAHLHLPAAPSALPAPDQFARAPRFSELMEKALGAAEGTGIFSHGHATLTQTYSGVWRIDLPEAGRSVEGANLRVVLCEASLLWVRRERDG